MIGRLSGSFNDKGFTFIRMDDGSPDVFAHVTQVEGGQDRSGFVGGAFVEFETTTVKRGDTEKIQAMCLRLLARAEAAVPGTAPREEHGGSVKFWNPSGYGFVVDEVSGAELFAHHSAVANGYLRQGDQLIFEIEDVAGKPRATNVRVTGWDPVERDPVATEVDLGHPNWAATLAGLAESKEDWNYRVKPSKDQFAILRSYMKYTYLRQRELDGHLVESADGLHMAFNTGLVTDFQEEIHAVFDRQVPGSGPTWRLTGFKKASDVTFLTVFGGGLPPLARYYGKADQLVYDTSLQLIVNVEHVPHDPDRFPEALKDFTAQDLAGLVNAKAPEAIERVKRNYKTAIPQFYRDGASGQGKMQMLLPVGLVRRDKVELALAVDRLDSGVYLGRTVLTLDWAYNNARLITRPDTDWLQP